MICFLCKASFSVLSLMIKHFKIKHDLTNNSLFRCSEIGCNQAFQSLTNFKKHVTRKHLVNMTPNGGKAEHEKKNGNLDIPVKNSISETTEIFSKNEMEHTFDGLTQNDSIATPPHLEETEKFCLYDINKELNNSFAEFVLSLNNNDNFSRKDVLDIQAVGKKYSKTIIKLISVIYGSFFKKRYYYL